MQISVIGAGVNGLSAAVKIAEHFYDNPNIHVNLISDEVTPNTTGDGSAGLWSPYLCGDTPSELIVKWSKETHEFLMDMWRNGMADELGICLQPMMRVITDVENFQDPPWKDVVLGYTKMDSVELKRLSEEHKRNYTGGYHFVSFTCEPTYLLPYLFKRFQHAGGKFEKRKVNSLDELYKSAVIVNCTGLNSRYLVNDTQVKPIRGQVTRVRAPWMYQVILDDSDDGNYVIPNCETVILGGTHQVDDFNTKVSPVDNDFILGGCQKLVPSLKNAPIHKHWVGLRPGRSSVRLERELYRTASGEQKIVIHNYGHGGSGVTLSWGCATDVLNLIKNEFDVKAKY